MRTPGGATFAKGVLRLASLPGLLSSCATTGIDISKTHLTCADAVVRARALPNHPFQEDGCAGAGLVIHGGQGEDALSSADQWALVGEPYDTANVHVFSGVYPFDAHLSGTFGIHNTQTTLVLGPMVGLGAAFAYYPLWYRLGLHGFGFVNGTRGVGATILPTTWMALGVGHKWSDLWYEEHDCRREETLRSCDISHENIEVGTDRRYWFEASLRFTPFLSEPADRLLPIHGTVRWERSLVDRRSYLQFGLEFAFVAPFSSSLMSSSALRDSSEKARESRKGLPNRDPRFHPGDSVRD